MFSQIPIRDFVHVPFKLQELQNLPVSSNLVTLVLSSKTFSPDLCNALFEIDHLCQQKQDPTCSSRFQNAVNMLNREAGRWSGQTREGWYIASHKYYREGLYFPFTSYNLQESEVDWDIADEFPVRDQKLRFLVSVKQVDAPADVPHLQFPNPEDIRVDVSETLPTTFRQEADRQLRLSAGLAQSENRKTVTYEDGSAVPEQAWHVVIPLTGKDPITGESVVTLLDDIIDQSLAQQAMNQRALDDAAVNKLVTSIMETNGFVNLPEKFGVLLCPRVYARLNDPSYQGDIFQGLTLEEKSYPRDPLQAILSGTRKLIIIAGNHTSVAQLKAVKLAISLKR